MFGLSYEIRLYRILFNTETNEIEICLRQKSDCSEAVQMYKCVSFFGNCEQCLKVACGTMFDRLYVWKVSKLETTCGCRKSPVESECQKQKDLKDYTGYTREENNNPKEPICGKWVKGEERKKIIGR